MNKHIPAVLVVVAITLAATGCAPTGETGGDTSVPVTSGACAPYTTGVVLAISVHQNAPAPDLPPAVACRVEKTIAASLPIGMVSIDGAPRQEFAPTTFEVQAASATETESKISTAIAQVESAARQIAARTDGADVFAGTALAARAAASASPPIADVVVIDSGASDRGVLTLTDPGMTLADPVQVAAAAHAESGLASDLFANQTITLVSFGFTADPQPTPSVLQSTAIPEIWKATLESFGATVVIDATPRSGEGPATEFTTGVFEPQERSVIDPGSPEPVVFDAGSALGFRPDTAEFRDPAGAQEALRPLAVWLSAEEGRSARIIGTTASPTPELNGPLSSSRAAVAAAVLVDVFGIDPASLTVVGAGYIASPDDHPDGVLDPGLAALNMTIRVEMVESS